MPRSQPTIRDVAALAGVSHQTVFRASEFRPKHAIGLNKLLQNWTFFSNAIARSMALGRSSTLACIAPNLTNYAFAAIIEGAQAEARKLGYYLIILSVDDQQIFRSVYHELVESRQVEALIVINPFAGYPDRDFQSKIPVVFIGVLPDRQASAVTFDDFGASIMATEHLLSLGHRNILHITGPLVEECAQNRLAMRREWQSRKLLALELICLARPSPENLFCVNLPRG